MGVIKPSVRPNLGGLEYFKAHGNTGTTEDINLAEGNVHTATLDDSCTFTFTGAISGLSCSFELRLTQDGTGSRLATWPGSVTWPSFGTPVLATAAGSIDVFVFESQDGGTTWYGFHITRAASGYSAVTWTSGTSMPGSPSTNDRVTRTDLGADFYYDGTRWLSTQIYTWEESVAALAATAGRYFPLRTAYDIYVVDFVATTFPAGTNDGTNYWTLTLAKVNAAASPTVIETLTNTSLDTDANWTNKVGSVNEVVDQATYRTLEIDFTTTAAPGTLFAGVMVTYRRIGT